MEICSRILKESYARAARRRGKPAIADAAIRQRIEHVALCLKNRAGVRALLAGLLAKLHNPQVDIRKPYTEIAGETGADCYSGWLYDERYIQQLADTPYFLPINSTTAFLTPGFRTKNIVLRTDVQLEGRPAEMYSALLALFDDIQCERVSSKAVMDEAIRLLIAERNQRQASIENLVRDIRRTADKLPLSAEEIVALISQHLACRNTSRIPVLILAAAYQVVSSRLGERMNPLYAHNAADRQTGAAGDIEITLINDSGVITAYEMKMKSVTISDINLAIEKCRHHGSTIQNYIFITTESVAAEVRQYAALKYDELGGVEIAILDCMGFLRHFLHLFHRLRTDFLDSYQQLLLAEPESAVSHALKEAFLTLRKAAEGAE